MWDGPMWCDEHPTWYGVTKTSILKEPNPQILNGKENTITDVISEKQWHISLKKKK